MKNNSDNKLIAIDMKMTQLMAAKPRPAHVTGTPLVRLENTDMRTGRIPLRQAWTMQQTRFSMKDF